MDFRAISRHMNTDGFKMGPSRVRLIMITALEEIVRGIVSRHSSRSMDEDEVRAIATSCDFQNVIAPFIVQAFREDEQAGDRDDLGCPASPVT